MGLSLFGRLGPHHDHVGGIDPDGTAGGGQLDEPFGAGLADQLANRLGRLIDHDGFLLSAGEGYEGGHDPKPIQRPQLRPARGGVCPGPDKRKAARMPILDLLDRSSVGIPLALTSTAILRVHEGLITEAWDELDLAGLVSQLVGD